MKARSLFKWSFHWSPLLAIGCLSGCASSSLSHPTQPDPPVIFIQQYPDHPSLGQGSKYGGGMLLEFWRDGRLIRSATPAAIGTAYVEGVVSPENCALIFSFLETPDASRIPPVGIPMHSAGQSIVIHRNGRVVKFWQVLLDSKSSWLKFESHLMAFPLQESHPISLETLRNESWQE